MIIAFGVFLILLVELKHVPNLIPISWGTNLSQWCFGWSVRALVFADWQCLIV